MRGCGGVVLAFGLISTAAFLTGFSTVYWYQNRMVHFGLWSFCDTISCGWNNIFNFGFMLAVRALAGITVGSAVIALGSNIGWVSRTEEEGQKSGCRVAQTFYTFAGVCGAVVVIVFPLSLRAYYNEHGINNFGYSFWTAAGGSAGFLLLGSISSCVTREWLRSNNRTVIQVGTYPATIATTSSIRAGPPHGYATQYPAANPPQNPYTGQQVVYPPSTYTNHAYRPEQNPQPNPPPYGLKS